MYVCYSPQSGDASGSSSAATTTTVRQRSSAWPWRCRVEREVRASRSIERERLCPLEWWVALYSRSLTVARFCYLSSCDRWHACCVDSAHSCVRCRVWSGARVVVIAHIPMYAAASGRYCLVMHLDTFREESGFLE